MVHYKMPLQRKNLPGNRNLSTSAYSRECRGWYSYLSRKEQKYWIVQMWASVVILSLMTYFKVKQEIKKTNFSKVQFHDVQNCSMFQDGSVNNMVFQRDIQIYRHWQTRNLQTLLNTNTSLGNRVSTGPLPRVNDAHSTPSICSVENTAKKIIQQMHKLNEIDVKTTSLNSLFHDII